METEIKEPMTFNEALKILNIEDYGERIFNSNSHGELFHIQQYFTIAKMFKSNPEGFRSWFVEVVELAEKNWQRPESIFQHIGKVLADSLQSVINENT